MNYQLSSAGFEDPNIPALLKILAKYFKGKGIEFYVVGAAARDIVLGMIHNRKTRRKTNDLDIAIMIRDWEAFEEVNSGLCGLPGFTKSSRQKQRFHYKNSLILDIIPFGEIARSDRNIYWPPEETPVMSVSGFTEMAKKALSVMIDDEFTVGVASLPGIFILKLVAWHDRHKITNKDADDIAYLIDEYLDINLERIAQEHPDIYERDDFATFTAGAILMGRDIQILLKGNKDMLEEFAKIIEEEIGKGEDSLLINQILETHRSKKYEEVNQALGLIVHEIRN
jgi:predicted nucleotidyltransferase